MKSVDAKVVGAAYVDEVDGVAVLLKDDDGNEYKHVMYSSEFKFHETMNRVEEMKKLASLMEGKKVRYCCDEDIEQQKNDAILKMMHKWDQSE